MNKLFYPSLFHKAEEGGFWVSFPDFPECFTQGDNMEEAYEMAVDALGLFIFDMFEENIPFPKPTELDNIIPEKDSFLVIIMFDMSEYARRNFSKMANRRIMPSGYSDDDFFLSSTYQELEETIKIKMRAKK